MDVFDEMVAKEQFIELIAVGNAPINAGIIVGWTPAQTHKFLRDPDFVDVVNGAMERRDGNVEEALYQRALAGNVAAMQMWLFNRRPDDWRDVKRIEIRSEQRIEVAAVESVKAGVIALIREQGVAAMQALDAGIIDAEIVDDDE
jgi:hypothetical protein